MKNLNLSKTGRTLLFFTLIYFTQINPLTNGHHYDYAGPAELKNGYGIIAAILKSTVHHTHFNEIPLPGNHDHSHEYKIIRNYAKKNIRQLETGDHKNIIPSTPVLYNNDQINYTLYTGLYYIAEHEDSSLIVRGPPLFA